MGDRPTLILLENFLEYVHRAIEVLGTDDPFLQQILTFIQNLISVIEDTANTVLVYSLPANQSSLLTAVETLVNATHTVDMRNFADLHSNPENEIAPENESTPETKKAIAVVNLDEHTYYSRPVSASNRRKKTVTKIWAGKRDRFSTDNSNFLLSHNLNSIASQQTTPEMGKTGDRLKVIPISNKIERDDGAIADIPTFYQGQKLSEIDLAIKELMARSPPK